jgi:hypothetical protein
MTPSPPRISAQISFSPFEADKPEGDWLVGSGEHYFKGDFETVRVLRALSEADGASYDEAYRRYRALAAHGMDRDAFVAWCEQRRADIEGLKVREGDRHQLKLRRILLSPSAVARIGRVFAPMFSRPALLLFAIAGFAAHLAISLADLAATDRIATSVPVAIALALFGVLVHELGHTTAAVRYGAEQGGIGIGLYWIWPSLYSDVRHTWKLPRLHRLAVSAGGLYFQALYVGALFLLHRLTGYDAFKVACAISLLLMATTLNPVFKFDGYWILTDLTNAVNLHKTIRATLTAMVQGPRSASWRTHVTRGRAALAIGFLLFGAAYLAYVFAMMVPVIGASASLVHRAFLAYGASPSSLPSPGMLGDAALGVLGTGFFSLLCGVLLWRTWAEIRAVAGRPSAPGAAGTGR